MSLKARLSRDGICTPTPKGWRLAIPAGSARHYRLSQLDDQLGIQRRSYPWHPPVTLTLRARVSDALIPGTWGFGLWNDPFGFSFGPGDEFFRLPTLPNATWFFHASPKNFLSFRDDKPAQGFLAQSFCSPSFRPSMIIAGLTLPFSSKTTRHILGRIVGEDAMRVSVDVTQWHAYRLEWSPGRTEYWVDEGLILESSISPRPPLGLVIWIDNQYAAFTPQGKLRWGVEQNPGEAWLEIEDVLIE